MKWTIDRFEGDFAVAECAGVYFNVPKKAVPPDVKEGSILEITVNYCETESKEENLKGRLKKLFGE